MYFAFTFWWPHILLWYVTIPQLDQSLRYTVCGNHIQPPKVLCIIRQTVYITAFLELTAHSSQGDSLSSEMLSSHHGCKKWLFKFPKPSLSARTRLAVLLKTVSSSRHFCLHNFLSHGFWHHSVWTLETVVCANPKWAVSEIFNSAYLTPTTMPQSKLLRSWVFFPILKNITGSSWPVSVCFYVSHRCHIIGCLANCMNEQVYRHSGQWGCLMYS